MAPSPSAADADLDVSVEVITPEIAEKYLALNDNPRKIRDHIVDRYAADMLEGRWKPGTGAIVFDSNGKLRDGQHRLSAAFRSETTFPCVVIRGMDPEAARDIDQGFKRTMADTLRHLGETDAPMLGGTIVLLWKWDNGLIVTSRRNPTMSEQLSYLDENPTIRDSIRAARGLIASPVHPRNSNAAALYHRISQIDQDVAHAFYAALRTGASLEADNAALVLRSALMNQRMTARGRMSPVHELAVMVKGWNAFINERAVELLSWRRGASEAFPFLQDANGEIYPFPETPSQMEKRDAERRAKHAKYQRDRTARRREEAAAAEAEQK